MPSCDYCERTATSAWVIPRPLPLYDPDEVVDARATIRPLWTCSDHAEHGQRLVDAASDVAAKEAP